MSTIVSILAIILMIILHELGHFIAGRICGAKIYEFSIGMGPLLWQKKGKKETKYSVRLFPIGGYCAFDPDDATGTMDSELNKLPVFKKIFICIAGPLMNILTAIILFIVIVFGFGILTTSTTIHTILKDTPTYNVLQNNDKIISVDDVILNDDYTTLRNILNESDGNEVKIIVERNGTNKEFLITPMLDEKSGNYVLGVELYAIPKKYDVKTSMKCVLSYTLNTVILTYQGLFELITGKANLKDASGIVGIVSMISSYANISQIQTFLNLLAFISINLGIMNLLPIPGLDGSKTLFAIYELITRRKISEKVETILTIVGVGLLLMIFVFITLNDMTNILFKI